MKRKHRAGRRTCGSTKTEETRTKITITKMGDHLVWNLPYDDFETGLRAVGLLPQSIRIQSEPSRKRIKRKKQDGSERWSCSSSRRRGLASSPAGGVPAADREPSNSEARTEQQPLFCRRFSCRADAGAPRWPLTNCVQRRSGRDAEDTHDQKTASTHPAELQTVRQPLRFFFEPFPTFLH